MVKNILDRGAEEAAAAEGVAETWDQYLAAWEAGDMETCANFYTEDGKNYPYFGVTQTGRAEIQSAFAGVQGSYDVVERVTEELLVHGDTAHEFGRFYQNHVVEGRESELMRMRYVSVLRREADGVWRFHRWMAQHEQ